jgi:hypothetical protein
MAIVTIIVFLSIFSRPTVWYAVCRIIVGKGEAEEDSKAVVSQ